MIGSQPLGPAARASLARRLRACLDLTELSETADAARIAALCARAAGPHGSVAAVCVPPAFVADAAAALRDGPVRVATVANFPEGDATLGEVERTIAAARAAGADEIDVVISWRALLRGEAAAVPALVAAARAACPRPTLLKVILETGALGEPRPIEQAAEAALAAGADFLKTSTGKTPIGATPAAVDLLLGAIARSGRPCGLKVSGGVRRFADAAGYLAQAEAAFGAAGPERFRIGASGLADELDAVIEGRAAPSETDGY